MSHNTWSDPRITGHSQIDTNDPEVRAAAEHLHANESIHRHDVSGKVCVYCALNASRTARALKFAQRKRESAALHDIAYLIQTAGGLTSLANAEEVVRIASEAINPAPAQPV